MTRKFNTAVPVVIGVSAGGITTLDRILPAIDAHLPLIIFVVQHVGPRAGEYLSEHFDKRSALTIKEAEDKEIPQPGVVYFAPPNYHLLLEPERTLALSTSPKVNFSRPSIDVLFETAAEAYREELIGIILTGASSDGARGLAKIKRLAG